LQNGLHLTSKSIDISDFSPNLACLDIW